MEQFLQINASGFKGKITEKGKINVNVREIYSFHKSAIRNGLSKENLNDFYRYGYIDNCIVYRVDISKVYMEGDYIFKDGLVELFKSEEELNERYKKLEALLVI